MKTKSCPNPTAAILALVFLAAMAGAQTTYYWDSNSTTAGFGNATGTWGSSTFWGTNSAGTGTTADATITSVDTVNFGTAGLNYGNGAIGVAAGGVTVGDIVIGAGQTTAVTLGTGGNSITVHSGITKNNGSAAFTLQSPVTLGASQTWLNNSSSTLEVAENIISPNVNFVTNGGFQLTIDGSGTTQIGRANETTHNSLSGTGALVKNGTGVLQLGGNNSAVFSGQVTINAGVLNYGDSPTSLGTGNLIITGGVVESRWNNGVSRTQGTGAGQIQITGGISGFSGGGGGVGAVTHNIGAITWGSATFNPTQFVLQSANSGNGTTTLSSAIDLNGADRTIRSDQTGTGSGTFSGLISNSSGTAGLTKTGIGQLVLSNASNTYNGNTTVNQGILTAAATGALPGYNAPGKVVVADGATIGVRTGASWTSANIDTLRANVTWSTTGSRLGLDTTAGAFTYASDITGAFSVHKIGGNNLTLTGANTYTGKTILGGGSVLVSSFGNVADASSPLGMNSTIEFLGGGTLTFTGSTVQSSDKTFDIAGTSTIYANGTGVGTITLTSDINSSSTSNKTLQLFGANTNDNTISGNISNGAGGTLAITKNNSGTWILSGSNTHTGGTTLSGGKLILRGSGALGAGSFTWNATGTTLHAQDDASMALPNTFNTNGRDITRTLVVDRLTPGAAVDLTLNTPRINLDTSNVFTVTKGAHITSGTPTVTFANGTNSSDSNNGSLTGGAGAGPVTFNPVGVDLIINNGITSSGRTRGYIFQGDTDGNILTGTFANGSGTSVRKAGSGTWRFNGTSLYTGPTEVVEGTLLVNGETLSTGLVNVSSGATLGGNGTVGQVTVADGFLSPGDGLFNTFTMNSLALDPSSTVILGLDDPFSIDGNDFVQVVDSLTLAGQINIHAQPGGSGYDFLTATAGTQWLVMTYAPGNLFSAGEVTVGSAPALASGLTWSLDTTSVDGSVFLTVAVPEPATSALLAAGMLVMLLRRRRAA